MYIECILFSQGYNKPRKWRSKQNTLWNQDCERQVVRKTVVVTKNNESRKQGVFYPIRVLGESDACQDT